MAHESYGAARPERGAVRAAIEAKVHAGALDPDPVQQALADRLDALERELRSASLSTKKSALGWLFGRRESAPVPRGVYVYGKVGRGKSMLMDLFFEKSAEPRKRRVHFHAFMGEVQERIAAHRAAVKAGKASGDDPIGPVAKAVAAETRLLCFDEFTVTDIADAMILSRLFEALFAEGIVLVATSNVAPDDLYKDGLNRPLFLPFVAVLKAHTDVFEVDAPTDYRLQTLGGDDLYLSPLSEATSAAFKGLWRSVLGSAHEAPETLSMKGRGLAVPRAGAGAARFAARELLEESLGAADFLAIAARFDTVFVDDLPRLEGRNEAKRFILLVDTLYDAGRRIVIRAQAPADELFAGRKGTTEAFEFDRTVSRLIEMRSDDYGARWGARRGAPSAGADEGRVGAEI
ncbi:cell division protein ZapE [Aureimonas mangrovi]|uniref:cell division protein ZapE n=1 Tax=Aureimonas mangrovi TaxID=2758041 RepID=UPI00163D4655|nr:cell division protein ZapE [Aureimonas mangrovi]